MICNKRQLAEIFGVSQRTLTAWQDEGLPIELAADRGLENQYDTAKVIEWRIQRQLAGARSETGREKLERLQAEKLEIEIGETTGRLVPMTEIEPVLSEAITAARGELLEARDRLKAKLDATYRINVDPNVIDVEILHALNKLASMAPALQDRGSVDSGQSPQVEPPQGAV